MLRRCHDLRRQEGFEAKNSGKPTEKVEVAEQQSDDQVSPACLSSFASAHPIQHPPFLHHRHTVQRVSRRILYCHYPNRIVTETIRKRGNAVDDTVQLPLDLSLHLFPWSDAPNPSWIVRKMASSLAAQLANVRSHNADKLTSSASLVKHTSYLFPPKTAAQQDLFTVHALGASGWTELSAQDATLQKWNNSTLLFGDESRNMDRLMLPKEDNEAIDNAVKEFLYLASPFLLSKGASKCLEWLVRRFRVHEFSVEDLLAALLPYHDTQQFARMLSICKLEGKPHLQFLLAVKKTASPLPAGVLHAAILAPATTTASLDLLRWISGLITNSVMSELNVAPHRALVNFWDLDFGSSMRGSLAHGRQSACRRSLKVNEQQQKVGQDEGG